MIRGDPCRKNLRINVTRLRDGDASTLLVEVVKVVKESLKAKLSDAMGRCWRCLIVCRTIGDADELGRELRVMLFYGNSSEEGQVLVYHSKRDSNVRESVLRRWDAGLRRGVTVMVATEGFCTGTDAPDVRTVVFAGGARSLLGILARGRSRRTGWKSG